MSFDYCKLEIKPCGFGSRIQYIKAELIHQLHIQTLSPLILTTVHLVQWPVLGGTKRTIFEWKKRENDNYFSAKSSLVFDPDTSVIYFPWKSCTNSTLDWSFSFTTGGLENKKCFIQERSNQFWNVANCALAIRIAYIWAYMQ